MTPTHHNHFLPDLLHTAVAAGTAILEVYQTDFAVEHKTDDSPLTLADKRSHDIIVTALTPLGLPILSEEGRDIPFSTRREWKRFWLVDPLDGTKEFIKKNGEFTVNIALIEDNAPVLGVIFVPVSGVIYFGGIASGAFRIDNPNFIDRLKSAATASDITVASITAAGCALPLAMPSRSPYTIVGSRSHATPELEAFVAEKRRTYDVVNFISAGSSLKFCQVAEGNAAIYPRMGPTMEWDTGAGHAIAVSAGATVVGQETGSPLIYNKENLLNPWFIVEMPLG